MLRLILTVIETPIADRNPKRAPSAKALTPLEIEVIDLFVQLSRLFGQPRSLGEIYGLLFISERPLAMDDFIERLNLSKGSASQGLKYLRNMGAIKTIESPDQRRVHYEAVAELRKLLTGFMRDQIVPQLDDGTERLERIAGMVNKLPQRDRARLQGRLQTLQNWSKRGRKFLPIIVKLLGG